MKTQKKGKLPRTDSIQELAKFWDSHDSADFADELEEVTNPVFARDDSIRLCLQSREASAVRKIAESKGISQAQLIREWVVQKLSHRKEGGPASR